MTGIALKYEEIPPIQTAIKGWTDYEDLYDTWIAAASDGDVFVEVGSFLGRSACYLGAGLKSAKKNVRVICVDTWTFPEDAFWIFLANMRQAELTDVLVPVRMKSVDAAKIVRNDLAAVFIDGDHEYDGVKEDIEAWMPKVRKGGILAGHDYQSGSFPGVDKAVQEVLGERVEKVSLQCWQVKL
jgi:predicted O-methyltransferase YrrM